MAVIDNLENDENVNECGHPTTIAVVIVKSKDYEKDKTEREFTSEGFVVLQTRKLSSNDVEDEIVDGDDQTSIAFLLQNSKKNDWNVNGDLITESQSIQALFPSVVLENYLIYPKDAESYLDTIKPALVSALTKICAKLPQDPVAFLAKCLLQDESTKVELT